MISILANRFFLHTAGYGVKDCFRGISFLSFGPREKGFEVQFMFRDSSEIVVVFIEYKTIGTNKSEVMEIFHDRKRHSIQEIINELY